MISKHTTIAWLAAITMLAIPAHVSFAQTEPAEQTPAAAAIPDDEQIVEEVKALIVPADLLAKIEGPAAELAAAITEVNKLLEGNIEEIENAETRFDQMVEAVRSAAATGEANSAFVKYIDKIVELSRKDALESRNAGDEEAAKAFDSYSADFISARDLAVKFHGDSFRVIRQIEKQKAFFVRRLKLRQYALAKQTAQSGLDLMKQFSGELAAIDAALPEPTTEEVEAQ